MRKFALSAFVILTFLFYTAHKRLEDSQGKKVSGQNNLAVLEQPAVMPTDGSGSNSADTSPTPAASNSSSNSSPASKPPGSQYKDGQYSGDSADAYYGFIQVRAIISGGKITDVVFLDYPQDRRTSIEINSQAMPYLKQEAIAAQSAQVDIVSGATDSSRAFVKSLQSALTKARS